LPTDYAKNHQGVDEWTAICKQMKAINAPHSIV